FCSLAVAPAARRGLSSFMTKCLTQRKKQAAKELRDEGCGFPLRLCAFAPTSSTLGLAPLEHGPGQRAAIHVLELAADRQPAGDAAPGETPGAQRLSQVMRRRLAF